MNNYNPKDFKFPRTYREGTGVEFGKGSTHEKYPWKGVFGVCIGIFLSFFICEKLWLRKETWLPRMAYLTWLWKLRMAVYGESAITLNMKLNWLHIVVMNEISLKGILVVLVISLAFGLVSSCSKNLKNNCDVNTKEINWCRK